MIKEKLMEHFKQFIVKRNLNNLVWSKMGPITQGVCVFVIADDFCRYWPNPLTRLNSVEINLGDPNIIKTLEDLCVHYNNSKYDIINRAIKF